MIHVPSRLLAAAAGLSLAASSLLVSLAPAQAKSVDIGTGRAVVHVDARTATLVKKAKGVYALTMPVKTTGQWMGERTDAKGNERIYVGDFDGHALARRWRDLQHSGARVGATLAWEKDGNRNAVPVRVHRPKVTATGIVFDISSRTTLPKRMRNVSIHLERAPEERATHREVPPTLTRTVVDDLTIEVIVRTASLIELAMYDAIQAPPDCTLNELTPKSTGAYLPPITCAGVVTKNDPDYYGVSATFPATSSDGESTQGSAQFALVITPPGAYAYTYVQVFEWSPPPSS